MTEEYKIQKKIAENNKLETARVVIATRSIFDFVVFQINSGNRLPIRIPKVGLFACKPKRVEELAKRNLL